MAAQATAFCSENRFEDKMLRKTYFYANRWFLKHNEFVVEFWK